MWPTSWRTKPCLTVTRQSAAITSSDPTREATRLAAGRPRRRREHGRDHRRRGDPVPFDRAGLGPHRRRVAADDLEGGAGEVVDIRQALAADASQSTIPVTTKAAANSARPAQPATGHRDHRDRDQPHGLDPDVELHQHLERRERAAAQGQQPRDPAGALGLERDEAPDDRDRDRHRLRPGDRADGVGEHGARGKAEAAPGRPEQAGREREPCEGRVEDAQGRGPVAGHRGLLEEAERSVGPDELGPLVEPEPGREVHTVDARGVETRGDAQRQQLPGRERDQGSEDGDDPRLSPRPRAGGRPPGRRQSTPGR